MQIVGFPAGMFQTNCYIVSDDSGDCVIVDPGQDSEAQVRQQVSEAGLRPRAVLLTHGHLDHIWNAQQVADHYGVPAYIHPDDREMLSDPAKGLSLDLSAMLKGAEFTEPAEVIEVFDGDSLTFGSMVFDVDHVPGHSPGSVSFRILVESEQGPRMVVLGGDVLFQDGVGRTDLPAGDTEVLMQSIAKKFLVLDDDAVVLPGHGPSTTIGRERRSNPFLRDL
ncbi:MBL fold metallo-hydrolase [Dietzia aurantiaca]|uniref:MBL fold metallo-hydrolase n=1 Tax=Dietzia aurantiaca TaxID=983873 RepID=UPI001E4B4BA3|nr:MBL fold metallo-hydrolase [Dietzia aurantiaca]MCD2261777.1 MBL fold metallo-hydrolase [Dietzia aurantiaca]